VRPVLLALLLPLAAAQGAPERIVSIGGAATETVFALGEGSRVVGVDTSSEFPEEAKALPQVGYQRALSAEGVASLSPDLVILSATAGPQEALTRLEELGIPLLRLGEGNSIEAAALRIRQIGKTLGKQSEADQLVLRLEREAGAIATAPWPPPRTLFLMSAAGGAPMAAGEGTAADAALQLAGGKNVARGFEGYKQLSQEAIVQLDPEIIVTTSRTIRNAGKAASELLPGLGVTSEGRAVRLIVMDDLYLLGFGPRTGGALAELSRQLSAGRAAVCQ